MNAIEKERAGNDQPAEPVPPIKTAGEAEITWLKIEVDEAATLVGRLEGQQRDCMKRLGELDGKISAAKQNLDEAKEKYHRIKPKPLPEIPHLEQMLAMARQQRPNADDHETVMMVSKLRGTLTVGSLAGEGLVHPVDENAMTGTEVRNTENHRYNIPAGPREKKVYNP